MIGPPSCFDLICGSADELAHALVILLRIAGPDSTAYTCVRLGQTDPLKECAGPYPPRPTASDPLDKAGPFKEKSRSEHGPAADSPARAGTSFGATWTAFMSLCARHAVRTVTCPKTRTASAGARECRSRLPASGLATRSARQARKALEVGRGSTSSAIHLRFIESCRSRRVLISERPLSAFGASKAPTSTD